VRKRIGRLFWLGFLFTMAFVFIPLWFPPVFSALPIQKTQTEPLRTSQILGGGYQVNNVTIIPVAATSVLSGNLTITGNAAAIYDGFWVMTEAQYDSCRPSQPNCIPTPAYNGQSRYVFDSVKCEVSFPFRFVSNSTTSYYFLLLTYPSSSAPYCAQNSNGYSYTAPKLHVFVTTDASSSIMTNGEVYAGVLLGVGAAVSEVVNEVGLRKEKKRAGQSPKVSSVRP
jgi:hypothetical protein